MAGKVLLITLRLILSEDYNNNKEQNMAKYILLYKGPATDMSAMTEEQVQSVMAAWQKWMNDLGDALHDVGQPMANGLSLVDDGSSGTPGLLNGYSIVEAASLDEAKKMSQEHPFLSEGKGNFAIDIYELMPVPMQ